MLQRKCGNAVWAPMHWRFMAGFCSLVPLLILVFECIFICCKSFLTLEYLSLALRPSLSVFSHKNHHFLTQFVFIRNRIVSTIHLSIHSFSAHRINVKFDRTTIKCVTNVNGMNKILRSDFLLIIFSYYRNNTYWSIELGIYVRKSRNPHASHRYIPHTYCTNCIK